MTRPIPRTAQEPKTATKVPHLHQGVSQNDLDNIGTLMQQEFGWSEPARQFQIDATRAQLKGEDTIVHAGTGSGKTAIVAGPHVLPCNKGRVTIFVSPLIALQEEMVTTFRTDFKQKAVAVNSTRQGSLKGLFKEIVSGKFQVVLISPEMLLSRRFITAVLRHPEFQSRILSVVVDEAHCVSHWGAGFRKKYGTLGVVRAFIPRHTPMVALSATLTSRVHRDIVSKLQFRSHFVDLNIGNDRPNVSLVVRACHRPMSSFLDLNFTIPTNTATKEDIPGTFIYSDNINEGGLIIDHLTSLLPPSLRDVGLIRPFNATHTQEYRSDVMEHFRRGSVRIMVCTDAAGMGCNLPNIQRVIQWKLPDKLSSFVQRAGRAGRAPGTTGLAVLLVEPTAYSKNPSIVVDVEKAKGPGAKGKGRRKQARGPSLKGWAKRHGRDRGATADANAKINLISIDVELLVDTSSADEGLLVFVQTACCRRGVLTEVYNNTQAAPSVPCCDICDPTLFAQTLPGPKPRGAARLPKTRDPSQVIIDKLITWRGEVLSENFPKASFGASAILGDELIKTLASHPPFDSLRALERILSTRWEWWDDYGRDLYKVIAATHDHLAAEEESQAEVQTTRAVRKRTRATIEQATEHDSAPTTSIPLSGALPPPVPTDSTAPTDPRCPSRINSPGSTETSGSISTQSGPPRKRQRTAAERGTPRKRAAGTQRSKAKMPAVASGSVPQVAQPSTMYPAQHLYWAPAAPGHAPHAYLWAPPPAAPYYQFPGMPIHPPPLRQHPSPQRTPWLPSQLPAPMYYASPQQYPPPHQPLLTPSHHSHPRDPLLTEQPSSSQIPSGSRISLGGQQPSGAPTGQQNHDSAG